jgi:predicted phage terminase large subunit-like protein
MPVEGNLVKEEWLKTYDQLPDLDSFDGVFLSWDTATKGSERADYSVCTVWGVMGRLYYLIEVVREKLDYPDLRNLAFDLVEEYSPHTVLVEDAVTGTALAQELRKEYHLRVLALTPKGDKEIRFSAQSAVFEQGRVLLPEKASWRDEFVKELLAFPGTKYDDQVDSVELFLRHVNGRREIHPQGERPRIRNRPRGTPRRFYPRAYLRSITGLQGGGSSLW